MRGGWGRMSACTAGTWETAPTTRSGGPLKTPEEPEERNGVRIQDQSLVE